jgi:hypothetical protein
VEAVDSWRREDERDDAYFEQGLKRIKGWGILEE